MMSDTSGRVSGLDGLRGVAAVLVVLGHSLLISETGYALITSPEPTAWSKRLLLIPVSLGTESVFTFFVLSGYVLSLAFTARTAATFSYGAPRLVRLLVPVAAAAVVGNIVQWFMRHSGVDPHSPWLQNGLTSFNPADLLRDFFVLDGTTWANGSAWSMTWEVLFSMMLPFVLAIVQWKARRTWVLHAVVLAVSVIILAVSKTTMGQVMPMFVVGAMLATIPRVRFPVVSEIGLYLLVAVLMTFRWIWPLITGDHLSPNARLIAVTVAASLLVLLARFGRLGRLLATAPFRFLGRISYSLYLIQAPIIVAVAFAAAVLTGADGMNLAVSAVALVTAFGVSLLFYVGVERPTHGLARRMRKQLLRRESAEATQS